MRWIFSLEHGELEAVREGREDALERMGTAFLEGCDSGAASRWEALEALGEVLRDERQRPIGLRLVHWLRRATADRGSEASFRIQRVAIETASINTHLDLVLTPSVFEPEDWGYTFLEGLLRGLTPLGGGVTVAEIGTGTGWISLALLASAGVERAVGYDINPIAVQIAGINAVINSYTESGAPRYDARRTLLWERFEARESDLLQSAIESGERAELVIGCIPQVLAPSPDLDPVRAVREGDESRLYDLSNYFVLQGVYEDQFGLGLLARALDQAVEVLAPGGRAVLNIAGRPGSEVIERMFARRGFEVQVVWSTRVQQAADTDIEVLAQLEARTGSPFEFYVDRHSRQPIGAGTAHALQSAGRPIWHDVRVYEASLRFERDMRGFLESVRKLDAGDMLDQLDLSRVSDEQIGFLRALTERFSTHRTAPYTHEAGGELLRRRVADYLERFYGLKGGPGALFVGPCREELLHGLLRARVEPGEAVLLSGSLRETYAGACRKAEVHPINANNDLDEIAALIEALRPALVAVAPTEYERRNTAGLRGLIEVTRRLGVTLVLDDSDDFVITSKHHRDALLDFLAREGRPDHVLVLIGLIANRVYPTLQPAILLGAVGPLRDAMVAFAEATYSRNDTFAEHYYEHLFEEILSFQLRRPDAQPTPLKAPEPSNLPLTRAMTRTLAWPAFDAHAPLTATRPLIRMDYGENELEIPERLFKGIVLGFTDLGDEVLERHTREAISGFCQATMGWCADSDDLVLGAGVFPLLYDTALALRQRADRPLTIALPQGHYGYLPPIFTLAGCEVLQIPALAEDGFLLTRTGLEAMEAEGHTIDILFINNPANPSGLVYPSDTLNALMNWAESRDVVIFSDEIFSLLDLGDTDCNEVASIFTVIGERPGLKERTVAFSGLSKAFAAGGLRMGWAAVSDPALATRLRELRTTPLARHACMATEVLLRPFRGGVSEGGQDVLTYLQNMRLALQSRRDRLVTLLVSHGLAPAEGDPAGLFVFPDLSPLEGRVYTADHGERVVLAQENIPRVLREHCGLQVNAGRWAGAPGHARLCFSLSEATFERALRRLRGFFDRLD